MSDTSTATGPSATDAEVIRFPALGANVAFTGFALFIMGVALYFMWRAHKRQSKPDAGFRDAVHSVKERMANAATDTPPVDGSEFNAQHCSTDCTEGHTYNPGCIHHVASTNDASAM